MAEVHFQFVYPKTCPGGHTAQLAFRSDVNMDNGFGYLVTRDQKLILSVCEFGHCHFIKKIDKIKNL